jgi:hypothetical protein
MVLFIQEEDMIKIKEKFVVNGAGNKREVVIPYRDYERLMEDLHDLAIIAERKNEETISHAEVLKRLKKDGLL